MTRFTTPLLIVFAPLAVSAAEVYHSPQDDGAAGPPLGLSENGAPAELALYIDGGPGESAPADKCTGAGAGAELCGWDIAIVASGGVTIDAFESDGEVTFSIDEGRTLRLIGGDPFAPEAGPERIGTLTVSALAEGDLQVVGNLAAGSSLEVETIPGALLAGTAIQADGDTDGVADAEDNCTLVSNPDQRDTNGDGYGNACDADLDNDGSINFIDLGIMKAEFFGNYADADLNGDGFVNFVDLGIMKDAFFGTPGPSGVAP